MSIGHLEKITKLMYEKGPDKPQKGDFRINVAFKDILNINAVSYTHLTLPTKA